MRTTARRATAWSRAGAVLAAALATTVPDLAREGLGLGPWPTAVVLALFLVAVAVTRRVLGDGPVLTSVAARVAVRVLALALGAALADGLAQGAGAGLGLGPAWTALLLLAAVAAVAPLAAG
jgi:uncharacterized membrane-anchored protein